MATLDSENPMSVSSAVLTLPSIKRFHLCVIHCAEVATCVLPHDTHIIFWRGANSPPPPSSAGRDLNLIAPVRKQSSLS